MVTVNGVISVMVMSLTLRGIPEDMVPELWARPPRVPWLCCPLLQTRVDWSGADLASRLDVSDRRSATTCPGCGSSVPRRRRPGPGGRYRLGVGAKLPPLLLDDEEAVAVAVGLRAATGVSGVEETSARALAKLEQVLPDRLRRKLTALVEATTAGPANTDSNVEDPTVDAAVLEAISLAIRDHDGIRCDYRDEPLRDRALPPGRVAASVVPRRPRPAARRVGAVPRRLAAPQDPGGRRFAPAAFPGDITEFVVREVARTGWAVHARIRIDAPADEVVARINPPSAPSSHTPTAAACWSPAATASRWSPSGSRCSACPST
jgi:hypothetical protein